MPQSLLKRTTNWWRQLNSKLYRKVKLSTRNSSNNSAASSSHTTLDWRSLSPDRPPLPFFLPDNSPNDNGDTTKPINRSIHIPSNNNITPVITIDKKNTNILDPSKSVNNSNKSRSNTITDERNYQPLCPILEESETMITESGSSRSNENNQLLSPSSIIMPEENNMSESGSAASSNSVIEPSRNQQEKKPLSKKPLFNLPEKETERASSSCSPPIADIQNTPRDRYMTDDAVGDEERCKRKFAKMVLAASKFQNRPEKDDRPTHMALLFDLHGNIDMMRMVRERKSEYHKFVGNSQYVPPELSINIEYQSELADTWVLGIFLYRMLVGKYPFSAPNDQQLFKKMLHGNFSIPNELSEDAKDLLKRMLAPDSTRASLDLVIHHPWLSAYRPLLLDHYYSSSGKNNKSSPNDNKTDHHSAPQQQRNTATSSIRRSGSVHTTSSFDQYRSNNNNKPISTKSNTRNRNVLKQAIMLLVQGPFPPPKQPYKDLSHLGTRETVFARQKSTTAV